MSLWKAMGIMLGIVFAAVLTLAFVKYRHISDAIAASAGFAPPPTAVTSTTAVVSEWNPSIDVVGSLHAIQGLTINAEERGQVEKIGFESGSLVKQGDLLVKLDTSVEEAQLKAAEARLDLARLNHKRAQTLKAGNAMAESAVDEAFSNLKQAEGEVAGIRAIIVKKTISAPFDGRAGIRMVNIGQHVPEGSAIVPLYAYDPIYVNFAVPQQHLQNIKIGQDVELTVDAFGDRRFTGKVTALDPQVDENTRNVRVQGTLANADEALRSGMFTKVKLLLSEKRSFVTIPSSAVLHAPYGDSVYVIEKKQGPDGKEFLGVSQRFVKLGERRGDQVAVLSGVESGQEVATSGLFQLRPDGPVQVNNKIQPSNEQAPKPLDT